MSGNLRRHAADMAAHGQSLWYDGISRGMLLSGELDRLVAEGVTGLTTNPSIFRDAVSGGDEYDRDIASAKLMRVSPEDTYEQIVAQDVGMAAAILAGVHHDTDGADGFVSMGISPLLERTDEMVLAAVRMLFLVGRSPNVMVKVPSTPEGIAAGRELLQRGVHVNFTLLFSVEAYRSVIAAHGAFAADGTESVASFFVRRVDAAVDALASDRGLGSGVKGVAGVAGCREAYAEFRKAGPVFGGSRPQRLLWASTGANRGYEDIHYPRRLVARDTVITLPPGTVSAIDMYDGDLGPPMRPDEHALRPVARAGIDMARVAGSLLAEGLEKFAAAHRAAVESVREKMEIG